MKLVNFNLEEALAQPERVVCFGVADGVKLVKWSYNEDVHNEGLEYPVARFVLLYLDLWLLLLCC